MNIRPIAGHSSIVSRAMTEPAFVMVTKYKTQQLKSSESIRKRREVAHKAIENELAFQSKLNHNRESTY